MKIILEISNEILKAYSKKAEALDVKMAAYFLRMAAKNAVLAELQGEIRCSDKDINSTAIEWEKPT